MKEKERIGMVISSERSQVGESRCIRPMGLPSQPEWKDQVEVALGDNSRTAKESVNSRGRGR